jgi:hypothetical protein
MYREFSQPSVGHIKTPSPLNSFSRTIFSYCCLIVRCCCCAPSISLASSNCFSPLLIIIRNAAILPTDPEPQSAQPRRPSPEAARSWPRRILSPEWGKWHRKERRHFGRLIIHNSAPGRVSATGEAGGGQPEPGPAGQGLPDRGHPPCACEA